MSDEQKYLLFVGYIEAPLSEQIHAAHRLRKTEFKEEDEKNLMKRGYSKEQVARIRNELIKAGIQNG